LKEVSKMESFLNDIVEVKTIDVSYADRDEAINSYLLQGWRLLSIHKTCYDYEFYPNEQTSHVLLGRPSDVSEYVRPVSPDEEWAREKREETLRAIRESTGSFPSNNDGDESLE
jgi:hypothetical protein